VAKRDKSTTDIQRLLKERRRVEQWLERLQTAADKTSVDVRERVRADYEERLTTVNGQLQQFVDQIEESLETHRTTRKGLKRREEDKSKELAEAELRHTVGEFDEDSWREKKAGILEELATLRAGLKEAEEEIEELEEVLAALEGGAGVDDGESDEDDEVPPVPVPAVESLSRGRAGKRKRPQTDAFGDELEFLKSVTDDDEQGPAADRASGSMRAIVDDEPESPRAKKPGARDIGAAGVTSADPQAKTPQSGTIDRSLKCKECGAMNLPTEWYCERCGAELAAL